MVLFQNVTKTYGNQTVLSDVSFSVLPGDFVFLVGRSGSGKTTIMRLLTSQTVHDEGDIHVGDLEVGKLRGGQVQELRRTVGVIYQDYKLLPERTVAENIALGLEIIGKSKDEIETRITDLLALIQLPEKRNVFPSQLSGGEAQRVSIARALATAPKVLFADEPTGNLDETTASQIVRLLAKINELGTTIMMATHNMALVSMLEKRVIELDAGRATERKAKSKTSKSPKAEEKEEKSKDSK